MTNEPRRVTFLIVPPVDMPLWRARLSLRTLFCALGLWSVATVVAGLVLGSGVDVALLRADNQVMRARMTFMASEMQRSRADIANAKRADERLRALLGMPNRQAIIENSGVGGASAAEQGALMSEFLKAPARENPSIVHQDIDALRRESRERVESYAEITKNIAFKRNLFRATPMGWPAPGRKTSPFGYRFSPFSADDDAEVREFHPGQDIANEAGTPIHATADGVVVRARYTTGYGLAVLIEHEFGYDTLFGHCSRLLVKAGDKVTRGQVVALMGSTGRSTGPHVHYEVWRKGKRVDPLAFLAVRDAD
jgi:murein DD-endopeptidase MepM/ murein hydrolase activator NlpD